MHQVPLQGSQIISKQYQRHGLECKSFNGIVAACGYRSLYLQLESGLSSNLLLEILDATGLNRGIISYQLQSAKQFLFCLAFKRKTKRDRGFVLDGRLCVSLQNCTTFTKRFKYRKRKIQYSPKS